MMLRKETWQQDPMDPDLWHGAEGVVINTAALETRSEYFEVERLNSLVYVFTLEEPVGVGA